MTLAEVINQLSKFSANKEVANILTQLFFLEMPENAEVDVEVLRKQLQTISSTDSDLSNAVYNALIFIAELKPLNDIDPITLEEIDEDNRVAISTGYQFDIQALIYFHNTRPYRGSLLQETPNSKWLLNPVTNMKFSEKDAVHIQSIARQKRIQIQGLKTEGQQQVVQPVIASPAQFAFFPPVQIPPQVVQPVIAPPAVQVSPQRWRKSADRWQPYDSGGQVNRQRDYRNENPVHIKSIALYGYTDGTYSFVLEAGHDAGNGWAMPTTEHNLQLIQALEANGLSADTANVERYPNTNSRYNNAFIMRAHANEISQVINQLLAAIESLEGEGACQTIRDEIVASFQVQAPQLQAPQLGI